MDLRSLNYFSVVAEEGNFTRAAQRLSMSQPPLSNQIKALEGQSLIVPHRRSRIDEIRSWFRQAGAEPTIIGEHSDYVDVLAMARANVGACIFPQTAPEPMPGVVCRRIVAPSRWARYLLVRKRNASMSELSQTFWDYVGDDLQAHPAAVPNRDG